MSEENSNTQFLTIYDGVPVAQTGWEVRVISPHDWSTILAYVSGWQKLDGSLALNDVGSGSIILPSDHPVLSTPFPGGLSGDIRSGEYLWQVYRDGHLRHEWISDDESEDELAEAGEATLTIAGRTLEKVLDWGIHRPQWGEVQEYTITGNPTGGSYKLVVRGKTTASIAWNASAATVQSRLEALPSVGEGNVLVTKEDWVYTVQFSGAFTGVNIPPIKGTSISLSGGSSPDITFPTTDDDNSWSDLDSTILGKPAIASVIAHYNRCVARGTLDFLTLTFDDETDSAGVPWADTTDVSIQPGETLRALLTRLSSMLGWEFKVLHGFQLWVAQNGYGNHREDEVVFFRGGQQISHTRKSSSRDVATDVYVQSGSYEVAHASASSDVTPNKRELWLEAGGAPSASAASLVGSATVDASKTKKISRTVKVKPQDEPRRIFVDFNLGDWVGLETRDGIETVKVVGISWSSTPDFDFDAEVVIQSAFDDRAVKLQRTLDRMGGQAQTGGRGSSPATPLPVISSFGIGDLTDVNLGGVEDNDTLIWDETTGTWNPFPFPTDLIDTFAELLDVDMTGVNVNQIPFWDGTKWVPGDNSGTPGTDGVGITSIALTSGDHSPGTSDIYTITLTDSSTYNFSVYNGSDGAGIEAIMEVDVTHDPGGLDTYLIVFEDTDKNFTFQVYNGLDGNPGFTVLADLTDVDIPSVPEDGWVLVFDSDTLIWEARPPVIPSLSELSDVDPDINPTQGEVLAWNDTSSQWEASTPVITTLGGLEDVEADTPVNNQVLTWDTSSGAWIPKTPVIPPSSLGDLTDVDLTGLVNNRFLKWDAGVGKWVPAVGGGGGGGVSSYSELDDVDVSGVLNGQVMVWNTSTNKWVPGSGGGGSGVPDGGDVGEVLAKLSDVDGDADWQNLFDLLYVTDTSQFRGEWSTGGVGGETLVYSEDFSNGMGDFTVEEVDGIFFARAQPTNDLSSSIIGNAEADYCLELTRPSSGGSSNDEGVTVALDLTLLPELSEVTPTRISYRYGQSSGGGKKTIVSLDEIEITNLTVGISWTNKELTTGVATAERLTIDHRATATLTAARNFVLTNFLIYGVPDGNTYMMNDTVVHDNKLWRSLFDNNMGEPGVDATWVEISIALTPLPQLPAGGATNEILSKDSDADGDVTWKPIFDLLGVTDMTLYKGAWAIGGIGGEELLFSEDFNGGQGSWTYNELDTDSRFSAGGIISLSTDAAPSPPASFTQGLNVIRDSSTAPMGDYGEYTRDISSISEGKVITRIKVWEGGRGAGVAVRSIRYARVGGIFYPGSGVVSGDVWTELDLLTSSLEPSSVSFGMMVDSTSGSGTAATYTFTGLRIYGVDSENTYGINDLVDHEGKLWRSLYNNNTEEPGTGSKWEEVIANVTPMPQLPPGGTTGQVLVKLSDDDGDVGWVTP